MTDPANETNPSIVELESPEILNRLRNAAFGIKWGLILLILFHFFPVVLILFRWLPYAYLLQLGIGHLIIGFGLWNLFAWRVNLPKHPVRMPMVWMWRGVVVGNLITILGTAEFMRFVRNNGLYFDNSTIDLADRMTTWTPYLMEIALTLRALSEVRLLFTLMNLKKWGIYSLISVWSTIASALVIAGLAVLGAGTQGAYEVGLQYLMVFVVMPALALIAVAGVVLTASGFCVAVNRLSTRRKTAQ